MPPDVLRTLGTAEGLEAFKEVWPDVVDAYFEALSNPRFANSLSFTISICRVPTLLDKVG